MTELTEKQKLFAREYLIDLNATQAAIRAGYSEKTAGVIGYENLTKPQIVEAIAVGQKERGQRTNITQDYVLMSIMETVERCKQAVPVLDRKGDPVMVKTVNGELAPAYTFQAGSVLKGSELLGKHLGMFVDRSEVSQTVNMISGEPMTEDDWEEQYVGD